MILSALNDEMLKIVIQHNILFYQNHYLRGGRLGNGYKLICGGAANLT